MCRRVVVTGLNMLTPLGLGLEPSWEGLVAGGSGVRRISLFDPSIYPTQIAGQLPDRFDQFARQFCSRRMEKQMARATKMGYACTQMAVAESGIDFGRYDRERCAVIFGSADTGHSSIYDDKYWIMKTMPHGVSAWIALQYKLEGANFTVSAACASSAYAIACGCDLIRAGRADLVIVGGASALVNPEHVSGFNELGALSTANAWPERASRPFSVDRDGFVIGEGAATLLLEAEESARSREATIYAEVAGYGMTSDAHNMMAPRPEGAGMAKTMRMALKHANIRRQDVQHISAHGSSTRSGDKYETLAIKDVFGERACQLPVSSPKSMIGHTAGACGAIEAVIAILSMCRGVLTPTINYTADPELDLDYVPNVARRQEANVALSNSFGFGGCNATLVLRRYASDGPSLF